MRILLAMSQCLCVCVSSFWALQEHRFSIVYNSVTYAVKSMLQFVLPGRVSLRHRA
uniref:Secreted protein n=1 Tax=Picea sitchensis TaxID=3332 RepID=A9NS73_PICSI|nr:unknown [Picea sitchensis]